MKKKIDVSEEIGRNYAFQIKHNLIGFSYVPQEYLTQEICDTGFKNDRYLTLIPEEFRTYDMCTKALKDDIEASPEPESYEQKYANVPFPTKTCKYIPKVLYDRALSELAIKASCSNFRFLPEEFITYDAVLRAVTNFKGMLEYVPKVYMSDDIIAAAAVKDCNITLIPKEKRLREYCINGLNPRISDAFEYLSEVPKEYFKDEEFCIKLIRRNRDTLEYLYRGLSMDLTDEMLVQANLCHNFRFEFLADEKNLTKKRYKTSVLKTIERYFKDPECSLRAVAKSPYGTDEDVIIFMLNNLTYKKRWGIDNIEPDARTDKVVRYIINNGNFYYGYYFKNVPRKFITQELATFIIEHIIHDRYPFYYEFSNMPIEYKTQELCNKAIDIDIRTVLTMPKKYITEDMVRIIKFKDSSDRHHDYSRLFGAFPQKFMTESMTVKYYRNSFRYSDPHIFARIPKEFKSKEFCEYAVLTRTANIKYVPDEFITSEFIIYALTNNEINRLNSKNLKKINLIDMDCCEKIKYFIETNAAIRDICLSLKPKTLMYVPDDQKTYNMCMKAVKKVGMVLEFVPERFRDEEMIEAALYKDRKAGKFVGATVAGTKYKHT